MEQQLPLSLPVIETPLGKVLLDLGQEHTPSTELQHQLWFRTLQVLAHPNYFTKAAHLASFCGLTQCAEK